MSGRTFLANGIAIADNYKTILNIIGHDFKLF
jgi:hypothetical protein